MAECRNQREEDRSRRGCHQRPSDEDHRRGDQRGGEEPALFEKVSPAPSLRFPPSDGFGFQRAGTLQEVQLPAGRKS